MELIETHVFTRQVVAEWSPDEYLNFQLHLLAHPDAGAVIPRSGGLRKLRWSMPGRGKRGGSRVIYFVQVAEGKLYLLYLYSKNARTDLTLTQLRTLRALIAGKEE
jgi:hypothetical protein